MLNTRRLHRLLALRNAKRSIDQEKRRRRQRNGSGGSNNQINVEAVASCEKWINLEVTSANAASSGTARPREVILRQ
jgi:hypothetical protein